MNSNKSIVLYNRIEREIQEWKDKAKEQRLILVANPPTVELDP